MIDGKSKHDRKVTSNMNIPFTLRGEFCLHRLICFTSSKRIQCLAALLALGASIGSAGAQIPANVTVDVSKPMATMPLQGIGVCTAVYDNNLIDTKVAPMLTAAGIKAVRYSGGLYADIFNWQNTTVNEGGYVNSNDSFTNFMKTVVNPAGAQAIITVNYGSNPTGTAGGDPNVAAAWVACANV